jgi:hypothetical protein
MERRGRGRRSRALAEREFVTAIEVLVGVGAMRFTLGTAWLVRGEVQGFARPTTLRRSDTGR